MNPDKVSAWYPYFCAFGLSISSFLYIAIDNLALTNLLILGWNAKTAVVGLMYKKVSLIINTFLLIIYFKTYAFVQLVYFFTFIDFCFEHILKVCNGFITYFLRLSN